MPPQSPAAASISAQDEKILVLDFGSQTAQLIARRVREQNVFCQMVRHDLSADRIREIAPKGLILSGGPASVYDKGSPHPDPRIFDLACEAFGVAPARALYVGDRLHTDAIGAAAAGLSGVWLDRGGAASATHYGEATAAGARVIRTLDELDGLL